MFSISNAMMWQVEVVQEDHWDYGPLQLVFIPERKNKRLEQVALVWDWNRSLSGGFSRPSDGLEFLRNELRITNLDNPNLIAVPRQPTATPSCTPCWLHSYHSRSSMTSGSSV